ncbi:Nitrile-specifier protein 5 [Coccomyxa sp. Obi]|nr:Nitrile-specifier protein 5 [Coccomyxa sp. Obi]
MKWTKANQEGLLPVARSSHTVTFIKSGKGKAYVFGGEHQPRTPIDSELHVYELDCGAWNPVQCSGDAPCPRVAHTAAAVGDTIYFFGGRSGIEMGEGSMNDLYSFDTKAGKWTRLEPKGALPEPRSFHAMVAIGSKIYVFGGCGKGGRLNDLHMFDTEAMEWLQMPSSPDIKGRGGAGLVASADGGSLFVVGGFAGYELNDVHRFDLAQRTWDCPACCSTEAAAASLLPARSVFGVSAHACGACEHGGHLVLFGGEVDPSDKGHAGAGQFSSETYCLDTAKGAAGWHKLETSGTAPTPRGWFAATAVPGGMLVHGGNSPSNERLDDMYILNLHGDN